jgi:hypothetical protein
MHCDVVKWKNNGGFKRVIQNGMPFAAFSSPIRKEQTLIFCKDFYAYIHLHYCNEFMSDKLGNKRCPPPILLVCVNAV